MRQETGTWGLRRGAGTWWWARAGPSRVLAMSRRSRRQWLEIEQIGDVHVAKFNTRHILDEDKLQGIGDQLLCLGKQAGHQRLILNLDGVQRLSTEVVGKFLTL